MRAISIQAPWIWFILLGLKPVENRTWATKYRGDLLLHAGKKYDHDGTMYLSSTPAFREDVNKYLDWIYSLDEKPLLGAIWGKVKIVDCVTAHPSPYFFGPYGHVYEKPVMFKKPIPYKGQLGIFDVPEECLPPHPKGGQHD